MKNTYVIVNNRSKFCTNARTMKWSEELPDALAWTSLSSARAALYEVQRAGYTAVIVENYGSGVQREFTGFPERSFDV